jgi:hypothetical protein
LLHCVIFYHLNFFKTSLDEKTTGKYQRKTQRHCFQISA